MKPFIKTSSVLIAGLLSASAACADLFESGDISLAAPDNSALGCSDALSVSGMEGVIDSISVSLDISAMEGDYAYNGDLYLYLSHGDDLAVLLNRVGKTSSNPWGYGDNGMDVTFVNDSYITGLGGVMEDFDIHTHSVSEALDFYVADGRATDPDSVLDTDTRSATLDEFAGTDANGEWTLFAADMNQGGLARVNNWSLNIISVPEPAVISLISMFGIGAVLMRRWFKN